MTQLDFITQAQQRQQAAQSELQRITDERRNSFETERYRRNRAAQLKRRVT